MGTLALLWALRSEKPQALDNNPALAIAAINQALAAYGPWWIVPPVALLMTIGGLGYLGAWLIGPTRLLLAGGLASYLPAAFARLHPKWNTPHVALFFQAGLIAAIFVIAFIGRSSFQTLFTILLNATLVLSFIPFLYIFGAAMCLRQEIGHTQGTRPIPYGRRMNRLVNGLGFATTLFAMVMAFVPDDSLDTITFALSVTIVPLMFLAIGLFFYLLAAWRRRARGVV